MSNKLITWAFGLDELPKGPTFLLVTLADQSTDEGVCWALLETLAQKTRDSKRTVQRHLKYLEQVGLISIHARSSQDGRLCNMYEIHQVDDFSLGNNQCDKMSCCETSSDPEPVDNPSLPREITNATKCRVADNSGSQHDTGVVLLPYGKEPMEWDGMEWARECPESVEVPDGTVHGVPDVVAPSQPDPGSADRRGPVELLEPDWSLIGKCLPDSMQGLDGQGASSVMAWLMQLTARGWTPKQIKASLAGNRLPGRIKNLTGLVLHRLRKLSQIPAPGERTKPHQVLAQPDVKQEPMSADEWRAAAHTWRTSTLATAEFRARRLAGTLVSLVRLEPDLLVEAHGELGGLDALTVEERARFAQELEEASREGRHP